MLRACVVRNVFALFYNDKLKLNMNSFGSVLTIYIYVICISFQFYGELWSTNSQAMFSQQIIFRHIFLVGN